MREVLRFKLRRKVAAAIMFIDDFSDKVLTANEIKVTAQDGLVKPIYKREGFFVFMDMEDSFKVEAEGLYFRPETVQVDLQRLPALHPVIKVRLQPNRLYPVPRNATIMQGQTAPGTVIRVFPVGTGQLRLLYDSSKSPKKDMLFIFNPTQMDLSGKTIAIGVKNSDQYEINTILEAADPEMGEYILSTPLKGKYKKSESYVMPIHTARADEKGEYYLPLKGLGGLDEAAVRVETAGEETAWEINLIIGKSNRVDLV